MTGGDCVRFGEFELDLGAFALRRSGRTVRLERLPMELLIRLVSTAGRLVERADLRNALWGSTLFLEHEAAINTAVAKVRRALEDDADRPRFVETVVGKGYRFVAPVARSDSIVPPRREAYCVVRGRRETSLHIGENLIGRDPRADVRVDHAAVSRHHARIVIGSDPPILEDLSSRNGTFIDGVRTVEPTPIHSGAVIGLGPIALVFRALPAPASTVPQSHRRSVRTSGHGS